MPAAILADMPSPTSRDRVFETLKVSTRPLDDDELSARAGVEPRQAVNQICLGLVRAGVLRRYIGPRRQDPKRAVMGPRFADATVLAVAASYEALAPWIDRRPPVTSGA